MDADFTIRIDEESMAALRKVSGLRRDHYAAAALSALIASRDVGDPRDPDDAPHVRRIVEASYAWADLMLAESERRYGVPDGE